MKSIICMLMAMTILTSSLLSQERDSLIQIYPGIGDTIDLFERNYFGFFPNIDGFEHAVVYIRNNENLVSKVTYSSDDVSKDTVFVQSLSVLERMRAIINKIEMRSNKKLESPLEVVIVNKNGSEYNAELGMFSKSHLYFFSDNNLLTGNSAEMKYKIPLSKVGSIIILGESNALSSCGWGALGGVIVGGILGFVGGDDSSGLFRFTAGEKAGLLGGFFGLIGGLIGLISGLTTSTDDVLININSEENVLKFKDYAKYYFIYDELTEQKYMEVK